MLAILFIFITILEFDFETALLTSAACILLAVLEVILWVVHPLL
jgi:hypothetical protein